MARNPEDSWNDLVARGVDLGVGMLRLYGEAVRDVATRKVSYGTLARRGADLARHEGGAYARAVTRASLDYWTRVMEVGAEATARQPRDRSNATSSSPDGAEKTARLDFQGTSGEALTRAFVVENNQPDPVSVSFELSPFMTPDGGEQRPLPLDVEPEAFVLEPGAEQVVTCHLILADDLEPGSQHRAMLRVMGFPDLEIELTATRV